MIWDQLTSPQIARLDKNIPVLLLIAATEQHGAHLPLSTDRLIGEYFTLQLNELDNDHILILPSISVGCSSHHMDFPGTLTLSHENFSHEVTDIVKSVIHHGFHKIILFNSHGGNQAIGQVLIERLGHQYPKIHFAMATWWRIAGEALNEITETASGGTGHACEFETSLMLLIAPHLVIMENIQPRENNSTFSWAEGDMLHGSKASYYRSMKEMTANGVFGDPVAASLEKGMKINEAVMISLKQMVTDLFEIK